MKKTGIENLQIYNEAFNISNQIWNLVQTWNWFSKDTLGKQFVRAADSVALNIAEGYGRFHFLDNRKFCFYARGSLQETITCLKMAKSRELITENNYDSIDNELNILARKLNNYITSISSKNNETIKK